MATKARKGTVKRAATLSINGPGRMTKRGRRNIATWLRRQAAHLLRDGDTFTDGRFTASLNYTGMT